MARILTISGHCQDRFTASLSGSGSREEYGPNYVPRELGIGGGDSIELQIDIDTGKIVGWTKPDNDTLDEYFPKNT